jgi:hypothetical protein
MSSRRNEGGFRGHDQDVDANDRRDRFEQLWRDHTAAIAAYRTLFSIAIMAVLVASCGNGPKRISHAQLANFSLVSPGILFELHPTERPIQIQVVAQRPLKVCQFGISFAGRWRGGCRSLGRHPLNLPTTNGFMHVAFRIVPASVSAKAIAVRRLDLRWHCTDHDFGVFPGRGEKLPRAAPTFDC